MLNFQRLIEVADDLNRLGPIDLHPFKGFISCDDLPHLRFNRRQVLFGNRSLGPHVIVKAVANSRAEGQFDVLEQSHHRSGHHMGGRVPHHRQRPRIARLKQFNRWLALLRQQTVEPNEFSSHQGGDWLAFAARVSLDCLGHIGQPAASRKRPGLRRGGGILGVNKRDREHGAKS